MSYFELVERINLLDLELNLFKGYMDLMLVVNLLFFDISKVIEILENKVYFYYLVYWGLVVVYRDLDDFKKVL